MDFIIEEMRMADWLQVAAIFQAGIETGTSTFLRNTPSWEEWDKEHCKDCRLVARAGENVLGWVAISPVSSRCVYAGIAEARAYIGKTYRGQGVGTAILTELIRRSEEAGYYSLQGEIVKENEASRALCKLCGFREIGYREKFGQMPDGKWHDVVMVERRSRMAGI